jgi:hypothetical protein
MNLPPVRGLLPASLMYFCSGEPMRVLSGVDTSPPSCLSTTPNITALRSVLANEQSAVAIHVDEPAEEIGIQFSDHARSVPGRRDGRAQSGARLR